MATKKANDINETNAPDNAQEPQTTATPEIPEAPKAVEEPKREKIFIPRGNANDEPNLLVSVNGKNYLLPRGKESEVPAEVAYEVKRAWRAQSAMDETIDKLKEAAQAQAVQ